MVRRGGIADLTKQRGSSPINAKRVVTIDSKGKIDAIKVSMLETEAYRQ